MWSDNSTVYIKLNYADASGGGKIVHSYEFPNVLGAFDVVSNPATTPHAQMLTICPATQGRVALQPDAA